MSLNFSLKREKVGTILGVNPPSRFGEIKLKNDEVVEFSEKPEFQDEWINGGYFFFQKGFFKKFPFQKRKLCTGEATFQINLTKDQQLNMYRHKGFWACMDTQRDREYLKPIMERRRRSMENITNII